MHSCSGTRICRKGILCGSRPESDEVLAALPGANCGGCGYAGCAACAEPSPPFKCPAGLLVSTWTSWAEKRKKRNAGLVLSVWATKQRQKEFIYDGRDCRINATRWRRRVITGCLGTNLRAACKFDAITSSTVLPLSSTKKNVYLAVLRHSLPEHNKMIPYEQDLPFSSS